MTHRAEHRLPRPDHPHAFVSEEYDPSYCVCGRGARSREHQPAWWRWLHPRTDKRAS